MSDAQRQVRDAIDRLVESGAETGLQVAAYRHGELVVDAVAGVADPATGRAVTADTPFFSASTGKSMTSTMMHVLVERGVFGYDTPIVALWPEFGAHGKQAATIRHALTHTVGVPGLPPDTTPEDLGDWQKMCAAIADAQPWWEPGTKYGYHAMTYGYIIGRSFAGLPVSPSRRCFGRRWRGRSASPTSCSLACRSRNWEGWPDWRKAKRRWMPSRSSSLRRRCRCSSK